MSLLENADNIYHEINKQHTISVRKPHLLISCFSIDPNDW